MNYDVIFESDRILFVKLSEHLVQDYLAMVNDINVQKFISKDRQEFTLEQELEWVKNKLNNKKIIFSMLEKGTNRFIGNIEIRKIENNIGELGITITPEQQNKHFGQEAIEAFLGYAYNVLGLDGMELNVYSFNSRGIHCYEKVGFVKDGLGEDPDDIHMVIRK